MNDKWIFWWLLFANTLLGLATIYRIWGYFQQDTRLRKLLVDRELEIDVMKEINAKKW